MGFFPRILGIVSIIELDDGKIGRKPLYLMVKTMVSCRLSRENQSIESIHGGKPQNTRGDILVDDKPRVTGGQPTLWTHVLFDQAYNRASRRRDSATATVATVAIEPLKIPWWIDCYRGLYYLVYWGLW